MFKKIMATTATLAIAATMCVSAFADDAITPKTDAITVTPVETADNLSMYTVMIFGAGFETTNEGVTTYDASKIYYINQGTVLADLVKDMKVKATTTTDGTTYLPEGTYTVRIGNDQGTVENITLTVIAEQTSPTTKKVTFLWGDINLDGYVNTGDISAITQRSIGGETTFTDLETGITFTIEQENVILWGDINLDGYVNTGDISAITQRSIGGETIFGNYTIETEVTIEVPLTE